MGSGYALLDLEPMPRAKIMKICYTLLDRLKEIPEKALYRIYTEEKVKYIMRLTDEIDDIRRLEEELGKNIYFGFFFEFFISFFHNCLKSFFFREETTLLRCSFNPFMRRLIC